MRTFSIVVAMHRESRGIGRDNDLPWRVKKDLQRFKQITTAANTANTANSDSNSAKRNAVIMGRRTWESLPARSRPLPGRLNVVLSSDPQSLSLTHTQDVLVCSSLTEALQRLEEDEAVGDVFVIGGERVFSEALSLSACRTVYVTEIHGEIAPPCDVFFPALPAERFRLVRRSARETETETDTLSFAFCEYEALPDTETAYETEALSASVSVSSAGVAVDRPLPLRPAVNAEEMQYLSVVRDILSRGTVRGDRTGTGTLSLFGVLMRFSLRDNAFPLITTKRVFWRGVAEELFWFIRGETNARTLQEKGVHIWDGNASRAFLDSRGLFDREEGDLGPVYGFQWRHFGAAYKDMHADYAGQGVDQLKTCIERIKHSPEDRRILMSAWNPLDLDKMALPPCHLLAQFYVANGELSCHMYQRSADMGLGVPFNIASYALLTVLVARVCGLRPGDFVHSIGDAHVYLNHVDALREQLQREPKPFPKLFVDRDTQDIEEFVFEDLRVEGYQPHAPIKMAMAV